MLSWLQLIDFFFFLEDGLQNMEAYAIGTGLEKVGQLTQWVNSDGYGSRGVELVACCVLMSGVYSTLSSPELRGSLAQLAGRSLVGAWELNLRPESESASPVATSYYLLTWAIVVFYALQTAKGCCLINKHWSKLYLLFILSERKGVGKNNCHSLYLQVKESSFDGSWIKILEQYVVQLSFLLCVPHRKKKMEKISDPIS